MSGPASSDPQELIRPLLVAVREWQAQHTDVAAGVWWSEDGLTGSPVVHVALSTAAAEWQREEIAQLARELGRAEVLRIVLRRHSQSDLIEGQRTALAYLERVAPSALASCGCDLIAGEVWVQLVTVDDAVVTGLERAVPVPLRISQGRAPSPL